MAENIAEELAHGAEAALKTTDGAAGKAVPSIDISLNKLARAGGFDLLEATIEGVSKNS